MSCPELLRLINAEINERPYCSEVGDDWTPILPGGSGDCDSYATAKMQALFNAKVPVSAMRLATCWTEGGEYHAVLLVDTDETTYVLDNRYALPMEYSLLPYKWHQLQVAGSKQWELA